MKDKTNEDFKTIKTFLEKGKFALDNPNFEENLMSKIVLEKNYRVRVRSFIKKGFICFIGGLTLCVILTLWFLFKNNSYEVISILCLFFLGILGVLLTDNYLKLLSNYKILN